MPASVNIGLVLADVPGYSETFFRSKIEYLQSSGKAKVFLFVDQCTDRSWVMCTVVTRGRQFRWKWVRAIQVSYVVLKSILTNPFRSFELLRYNIRSGFGFRRILISQWVSSHIISYDLDWLHFGFATMAIDRENLAKAMKARMAVSVRGYDISIYPLKHNRCYDTLWECVDKTHVISDDLHKLVLLNGHRSDVPILKITPAIRAEQFATRTSEVHFQEPIRIVTTARLHWKKGLHYTIDALRELALARIDFIYTIIGDGPEYERLRFAVYQHGLDKAVNFAGKLTHPEVARVLRGNDIYIQYSVQEGFCNSVLEAQCVGLLCIVSDAEGLAENVIHGQTGWVVRKRGPSLLSKQIMEVLTTDPDQLTEIKKKARQRVISEFNIAKQQGRFLDFYEVGRTIGQGYK